MNRDSDFWAPIVFGGLAYLAGRQHLQEWEPFKQAYEERGQHLRYNTVIAPHAFFGSAEGAWTIYREGVYAYLFGLPNASIPMVVRCLELGLKTRYRLDEGKEPPQTLEKCIDWSEAHLGRKKEVAHGFRILRNLIHGDATAGEPDALEAIRHVTLILNELFPFENLELSRACDKCRQLNPYSIPASMVYWGNSIPLLCNACGATSQMPIIP